MNKLTIAFGIFTLFAIPSTFAQTSQASEIQASAAEPFQIVGKMVHTTLEGGCWYLEANDGKHYELVGNPEVIGKLHEEGRTATLWVEHAKNRASICMVGEIVNVISDLTQLHPIDLVIMPMQMNGRVHKTKSGVWYVQVKEGARYEFKGLPPTRYRKENARINTAMRVLLDKSSTKTGAAGVILEPTKKPAPKKKIMIEKKNDPR